MQNVASLSPERARLLLDAQTNLVLELSRGCTFEDSLRHCYEAARSISGLDCGGIYLRREDGTLELAFHDGLSERFVAAVARIEPDAPQARIVSQGVPLFANMQDLAGDDETRLGEGLQAFAGIPTTSDGRVVGWLNVASREMDSVPEDIRRGLLALGAFIGQIIEREATIAALRERESNLSSFFASVTEFLFVLDEQGRMLRVNPAVVERLGYAENELLGKSVLEVHPPDRRDEAGAVVAAMLQGDSDVCTVPLMTRTGGLIPVETRISRSTWMGRPAIFGVSRDVSERERIEAERLKLDRQVQLAQKLESLGVLAGGIAHDFNNILMAVLGNASIVLDELPGTAPVRRCVEDIEVAARRAAELCLQLLAYSGRGQFVTTPVDLRDVVVETTHLLQATISKSARLEFLLESDLPLTRADVNQIRQVIMNLVINASEALDGESGSITVGTGVETCSTEDLAGMAYAEYAEPGDFVWLEVADTGSGMDAETVDRIFDPFFTTKFTGRGLGMAAVLGIVRGHGGALAIESEAGRGSRFRILFPVEVELPGAEAAPGAVSTGRLPGGCILLVDDDEDVLSLGRRMLEHLGLDVITASDGREALDVHAARAEEIQIVLLDMTMPSMDGRDVYLAFRERAPDLPVIVSSGFSEIEIETRFGDDRPAVFLQKPYTLQDLRDVLAERMGG